MFLDDNPLIMIQVILLVSGICALSWGVLTLPLKIGRRIAAAMVGANGLFLMAFWLLSQRNGNGGDSFLLGAGPSVGVLAGLLLLRVGLQQMTQQPVKWKEYLLVIPLIIGIAKIVSPLASSVHPLIGSVVAMITVYLLGAWAMLRCVREIAGSLLAEFGVFATVVITSPFAVAGVLLFGNVLGLLALPQYYVIQFNIYGITPLFLWLTLSLLLAGNGSIIGIFIARLVAQIRVLAERDVLTGVWNRAAIEQRLDLARERFQRYGESYALVLLDLDHFKAVNDRLGHDGGDAALKHATHAINESLRQLDLLGRFGGEEFLVLLPMTDQVGALGAAERMRQALADRPLFWQGQSIPITASFGVANATHPAESSDALVQRADKALYAAKANGRNRVEVEDATAS